MARIALALALAPLLLLAAAPPAQAATLAPHAVAAGQVRVTYVAEVIDVCVDTLGAAAVTVDSVTDSFVVEIVAANPACSYPAHVHVGDPARRACTFALNGDVRCSTSSVLGYMEFTLSAGGAFRFTSMGPASWTVHGTLTRA